MSEKLRLISNLESQVPVTMTQTPNPIQSADLNSAVPLVVEFGYTFIIGMAFGWALRKSFRWIALIVGIGIALTLTYQFFGGGNTQFNGIESHYAVVAPVFQNSLRFITEFIQGNTIRVVAFWMGTITGSMRRKESRRVGGWIRF